METTDLKDNAAVRSMRDKKINVIYVTDPICCYCWEAEPYIRKFRALYESKVNFTTLMGGLLEKWEGFEDHNNGIDSPSDVKAHWMEASEKFGMPINPSVWDNDMISSSYPPSRVYKIVRKISKTSAEKYLRSAREEVMMSGRNIARDSVLEDILYRLDRNGKKIVADSKTDDAVKMLEEDFKMNNELGVNSFPTLVFLNEEGNGFKLPGLTCFEDYEEALKAVAGGDIEPDPLPELKDMFNLSRNVFFREIEEMYDLEPEETEEFIKHNLPENSYEIREVSGGKYIIRK